jgi:hypothetical protein
MPASALCGSDFGGRLRSDSNEPDGCPAPVFADRRCMAKPMAEAVISSSPPQRCTTSRTRQQWCHAHLGACSLYAAESLRGLGDDRRRPSSVAQATTPDRQRNVARCRHWHGATSEIAGTCRSLGGRCSSAPAFPSLRDLQHLTYVDAVRVGDVVEVRQDLYSRSKAERNPVQVIASDHRVAACW